MKESIDNFLHRKGVIPAIVGVASFSVGAGLGYILGKRNGDVFIVPAEALEENEPEDPQMSLFDVMVDEVNPEPDPPFEFVNPPKVESFIRLPQPEEEPEPVKKNVFEGVDPYWDYERELATRKPDEPYVIHQDEFINDEMGYRQETLTYYAGDDIMADTDDTPIYNYAGMMGELKFGHGSKDPNVVYIRNEAIHMEWEILLHQGHFSHEVLGYSMEKDAEEDLHHSVYKFRPE